LLCEKLDFIERQNNIIKDIKNVSKKFKEKKSCKKVKNENVYECKKMELEVK